MRAFSLVELSIVLVILGLLTGGILAGQSLIRAAELRAVTSEYQRFTSATFTFRDRYMALPGDFRVATRFWGFAGTTAAPGCVSNASITAISSPGTCDGNGSGIIENASVAGNTSERHRFWQQLALAGLIEGTYTGNSGSGGGDEAILGTNVPRSRISDAGWSVWSSNAPYSNSSTFLYDYGNILMFGKPIATDKTQNPALKPEEAWNIDMKLDDGKPAQGRMIGYPLGSCTTASGNTDYAAEYRLTSSSIACAFMLRLF